MEHPDFIISDAAQGTDFSKVTKVAFYATYAWLSRVSARHFDHCQALKDAGYFVVACRAEDRREATVDIKQIGHIDILRKNRGHDFGSYWSGLQWLKASQEIDEDQVGTICLMNDSFFGHVSAEALLSLEALSGGLTGISECLQTQRHIQSFLAIAKEDFVKDGTFSNFLDSYTFPSCKWDVIRQGEFALTNTAVNAGANCTTFQNYADMLNAWMTNLDSMIEDELEAREIFGLPTSKAEIAEKFETRVRYMLSADDTCPHRAMWQAFKGQGYEIFKRDLLEAAFDLCDNPFHLFRTVALSPAYHHVMDSYLYERWQGPTAQQAVVMSILNTYRRHAGLESLRLAAE